MLACVGKVERRDMEDVVALLHESVQTCQQLLHKAGSANPGPSRALPRRYRRVGTDESVQTAARVGTDVPAAAAQGRLSKPRPLPRPPAPLPPPPPPPSSWELVSPPFLYFSASVTVRWSGARRSKAPGPCLGLVW